MRGRCVREAWARASSGRGRASQRSLGSSRLGARVWGRRGKVWRAGSNYQCCAASVCSVKGRGLQLLLSGHHAPRRHQTRSPLLPLTDERRATPSQRRRMRTGRRQARAESSSAAKTHLRAQTQATTRLRRQAAPSRRLFWACARPTPQLSIRVIGFARAAIRLTRPQTLAQSRRSQAWQTCPKVEQAAVGRVLVLVV